MGVACPDIASSIGRVSDDRSVRLTLGLAKFLGCSLFRRIGDRRRPTVAVACFLGSKADGAVSTGGAAI